MSSYILSKLTIHNFGPFKGTHVLDNIHEKQIMGIVGRYHGAVGRSNRSGKSIILESIQYLLTGKSRTKTDKKLIHHGTDAMFIEGVFIDDDGIEEDKIVKRGRDIKGKGLLEVGWATKSKDASAEIVKTFGVSPDDFDILAFFTQGDIAGFMKKKPAEQTEDMMKWLNNTHWDERAEKVKVDIKSARGKLSDVEATKRALESSLDSSDAIEIEIREKDKEADRLDALLKEEEKIIAVHKDKRANCVAEQLKMREDIGVLSGKIKIAKDNASEIEKIKRDTLKYESELTSINKDIEAYSHIDITQEELDVLIEDYGKLKGETEQLEKKIKMIKSSGGICPILQGPCTVATLDESLEDKYKAELATLDEKRSELSRTIEDAKALLAILSDVDYINGELQANAERLETLYTTDIEDVKTKHDELSNKLLNIQHEINVLDSKIKECNLIADDHSDTITELDNEIGILKHRLSVYDETLNKINERGETAKKLRTALADLSDIAMMFSKHGIPADEIDNSLGDIQDGVNLIMELAGLDATMTISPDREINGKEPVCVCGHHFLKNSRGNCPECDAERRNKRKTELTIELSEAGNISQWDMDSGGGKALIAFAVRIAINLIKREKQSTHLNMLFLDEVDAPFDDYHLDKLASIITKALIQRFGYRQIMLISHNSKIRDSIDDIIEVVRYSDNTSSVGFLS